MAHLNKKKSYFLSNFVHLLAIGSCFTFVKLNESLLASGIPAGIPATSPMYFQTDCPSPTLHLLFKKCRVAFSFLSPQNRKYVFTSLFFLHMLVFQNRFYSVGSVMPHSQPGTVASVPAITGAWGPSY